jgi:hypothetical protein
MLGLYRVRETFMKMYIGLASNARLALLNEVLKLRLIRTSNVLTTEVSCLILFKEAFVFTKLVDTLCAKMRRYLLLK